MGGCSVRPLYPGRFDVGWWPSSSVEDQPDAVAAALDPIQLDRVDLETLTEGCSAGALFLERQESLPLHGDAERCEVLLPLRNSKPWGGAPFALSMKSLVRIP